MKIKYGKLPVRCALVICLVLSLASCRETAVEHVHSTVILEATEANCSTPGRTQGEKCTVCGQMTIVQQIIPATGHAYSDEWTVDREPTEYQSGERSRHCTICGERIAITEIPRLSTYTEGLAYELNEQGDGYVCVGIGNAGSVTDLHIPPTYQGLPVTAIANSAFAYNTKLLSLNVGSNVRFIDKGAFLGCKALRSIELPDSVEYIAGSAFSATALHQDSQMWENGALYIGNHLIEVRPASVSGSYTIHSGTRTVSGTAFYKCTQLTDIIVPEGVVSIGNSAFYGCSALRSIQLPASLETIGQGALAYCTALQEFTLPIGVREILSNPFPGCSALRIIRVEEGNPYFVGVNNCLIERAEGKLWSAGIGATLPTDGSVRTIGMAAFYQNRALTDIVIPEGVTSIGQSAFYECTNLRTVTLPSTLTSLDTQAFYACSSLTDITLPGSVRSIGESAFAYCNKMTAARLPNGITHIGKNAFASCFALSLINLPDSLEYLGTDALLQCQQLQTEEYEGLLYLGNWLVGTKSKDLASASLKPTTRGIASSAFAGCSQLKSVQLPKSLIFIGDNAFLSCWQLSELHIPEGVSTLGDKALAYCSYLTDLYLPASLTVIKSQALLNCSALQRIHFAGTPLAWDTMQKESGWDSGAGSYIVQFAQ